MPDLYSDMSDKFPRKGCEGPRVCEVSLGSADFGTKREIFKRFSPSSMFQKPNKNYLLTVKVSTRVSYISQPQISRG